MVYCAICGRYFRTAIGAMRHFIYAHRDKYVPGAGLTYLIEKRYIITEDMVQDFFNGLRNGRKITDVTVLRRCLDDPTKLIVRLTRDDGERIVVIMSEEGLDYLRTVLKLKTGRWVW
ncbi:MAG: hypothetical protein ACTSVD_06780 [Candidatus Thorarchaeota archaeon]